MYNSCSSLSGISRTMGSLSGSSSMTGSSSLSADDAVMTHSVILSHKFRSDTDVGKFICAYNGLISFNFESAL